MRKYICLLLAAVLATACQSKHEQLQKEIEQRSAQLRQHQDSALKASQKDVEQLDQELQRVNAEYERMKKAADAAHANGTGTAAQFEAVTKMRLHRDSLQTQFDVQCAKIKYIRKRMDENK